MRRPIARFFALAALSGALSLSAPAWAGAPAPYTDWAFDLGRATKKDDAERLLALAKAKPEFARIWFYGRVLDLSTVGVTDELKAELKPQLTRLAQALAGMDPPDYRPQLLLDRAESGRLAPYADEARQLETQILDAVRSEDAMPARLAAILKPEVAEIVFYSLFHRAELASQRLGGDREKALYLTTARRMAEGFALTEGELEPWTTLSAYFGEGGVPTGGEGVIEEQLAFAFQRQLAKDSPESRRRLDEALSVARTTRGANLFTALIMNGAAHGAAWAGDRVSERSLRVGVLQAVRPLGQAGLTALVADQLVRSHLADGALDDMLPYSRELRALGAATTQVGRHLETLRLAAVALADGVESRVAAGKLPDAERILAEALALSALFATREAVALEVPQARVEAVFAERVKGQARLHGLAAQIALRRGDGEAALAEVDEARRLHGEVLKDPGGAARYAPLAARTWLLRAEPKKALDELIPARALLGSDRPAIADNLAAHAEARLRLGDYAPAFAAANQGLSLVCKAEESARCARLHWLAGLILDAAGFPEPAEQRLAHAQALNEASGAVVAEIADTYALALARKPTPERLNQARAALSTLPGDGRLTALKLGCLYAAVGEDALALRSLASVRTLTLAHHAPDKLVAFTCQAHAALGAGDLGLAEQAIDGARRLLGEIKDPQLSWRVAALDAELLRRNGRPLEAAGAGRLAIDQYHAALRGQPARGATLDLDTLALPRSLDAVLETLPDVLVDSARRDPAGAQAHLRAAASVILYRRALASHTPMDPMVEASVRPEADRPARAALARVAALRTLLGDEAVAGEHRTTVQAALAQAAEALFEADAKRKAEAPVFADRVAPTVPSATEQLLAEGTARLIYQVGVGRSHLLIALPGGKMEYVPLAGEAALKAKVAEVTALLNRAPKAWPTDPKAQKALRKDPNADDYQVLSEALALVVPPLTRKSALTGLRLEILADGPLVDLPFEALVLAPAAKKAPLGTPPVFVGQRFEVVLGVGPQAAGQPARDLPASFGPIKSGDAACQPETLAAEAVTVIAGFDENPMITRYGEGKTLAADLGAAMGLHGQLALTNPVDLETGRFLVDDAQGKAAWLEPAELTPTSAELVLSHPCGSDGRLMRLMRRLRPGGLKQVTLLGSRVGVDSDLTLVGRIARRVGNGEATESAIRAEKRALAGKVINRAVGGPAEHHPYYWAWPRVYLFP